MLSEEAAPDFARLPLAPRPATGPDDRPALPRRNQPAYSVRDMEVLPGDVQASAGFIDGVPEDVAVEAVPRDDDSITTGETSADKERPDD